MRRVAALTGSAFAAWSFARCDSSTACVSGSVRTADGRCAVPMTGSQLESLRLCTSTSRVAALLSAKVRHGEWGVEVVGERGCGVPCGCDPGPILGKCVVLVVLSLDVFRAPTWGRGTEVCKGGWGPVGALGKFFIFFTESQPGDGPHSQSLAPCPLHPTPSPSFIHSEILFNTAPLSTMSYLRGLQVAPGTGSCAGVGPLSVQPCCIVAPGQYRAWAAVWQWPWVALGFF
jgi:hypothetical protein